MLAQRTGGFFEGALSLGDGGGSGGAGVGAAGGATSARPAEVRGRQLASAMERLVITNHPAQTFPRLGGAFVHHGFDRIVCDVPCSGDGTLRKGPELWNRWSPRLGNTLHSTQLQIALRGVALLRPGGMMTYSTCTFNPIEDEAVVAALLHACDGSVELVDAAAELLGHQQQRQGGGEVVGGLTVRAGLQEWVVMDEEMRQVACPHTYGKKDDGGGDDWEGGGWEGGRRRAAAACGSATACGRRRATAPLGRRRCGGSCRSACG